MHCLPAHKIARLPWGEGDIFIVAGQGGNSLAQANGAARFCRQSARADGMMAGGRGGFARRGKRAGERAVEVPSGGLSAVDGGGPFALSRKPARSARQSAPPGARRDPPSSGRTVGGPFGSQGNRIFPRRGSPSPFSPCRRERGSLSSPSPHLGQARIPMRCAGGGRLGGLRRKAVRRRLTAADGPGMLVCKEKIGE